MWALKRTGGADIQYEEVLARAVRRPDPVLKVYEGWVVRGLAPDRCRIGLSELGPERDERRMMQAMGGRPPTSTWGHGPWLKPFLKI